MKTDELIERLAQDVRSVRPLARPTTRAGQWLLVGAAYVAAGVGMVTAGLFPGGGSLESVYLLQQGCALATGAFAAVAAFASVIPGARRGALTLTALSASAWLGVLLWGSVNDLRTHGTFGVGSQTDWPCVVAIVIGAGALWAAMAPMLRRGVPMTPGLTAGLSAVAALGIANVVACLTQPHAFSSVILIWHGGTAVLMLVLSVTGGQRLIAEARG